jgi:hypothetical protein
MLYRIVAICIVLFWLTMTGLLIHQEVRPGDSVLREVPPAHVMKLIFMRRKPTSLDIYSDKLRLGHLNMIPGVGADGQMRNLKFDGDLQLLVPGAKRERIHWEGRWEMDKLLTTKTFELTVTTHTPVELKTTIEVVPAENVAHFEMRAANGANQHQDYTLDERGMRTALEQTGIDPSLLPVSMKPQTAASFDIRARQSTLNFPGGQIDTYLVTVETSGQTLLEFHVDALGRIVQADTLLGYRLVSESMTP